ncbi:hypothetical protein ACQPZF_06520 [Actinosynnema sp. CS-041913]|uniref:NACHT N-terminal Helical domain 1-containing protein n=1 Tax=Actinosynnema sp. CS-041913 TaxID=3239917 RepID=UPI003D922A3E
MAGTSPQDQAAQRAARFEHETTAALTAVSDALMSLDLSDEALPAADADPEVLARQVRASLRREAGLSDRATRLYDVALDRACRYLVQVIRHLPAFQPWALAELHLYGRATANLRAVSRLERLERLYVTNWRRPEPIDLRPLRDMSVRLEMTRSDRCTGLDELGPGVRVEYYR